MSWQVCAILLGFVLLAAALLFGAWLWPAFTKPAVIIGLLLAALFWFVVTRIADAAWRP